MTNFENTTVAYLKTACNLLGTRRVAKNYREGIPYTGSDKAQACEI
jgi:hypothetical protein